MVSRKVPWGRKSPADQGPVEVGSEPERGRSEAGQGQIAQHPRIPPLLPGTDGRSAWSRRARTILAAHISDLGGVENTSVAERSLARRCAVLQIALEQIEAKWAAADGAIHHVDMDLYSRGVGHLRRALETLHKRLERKAKNVSPGQRLIDLYRLEGKIPYDQEDNENEQG